MNKLFRRCGLIVSAFACFSANSALAADIDCSSVAVTQSGVTYTVPAEFPNPSRKVSESTYGQTAFSDFSRCGFTVSKDNSGFTIKATDKQRLAELLAPGTDKSVLAYSANSYRFSVGTAFFTFYVGFNAKSNILFTDASAYVEGSRYGKKEAYIVFKSNTVAYKVNGGSLKPLFFEGVESQSNPLSDSDIIDVYVMYKASYDSVPRFTLNLKENSVKFWTSSSFPAQ